jgi:acetyltransferase-like isoleucine patch superfamily enzyme
MNRVAAGLMLTFRIVAERLTRLPMHARVRPSLLRLLGARVGRGVRIDEVMFINLSIGFRNLAVGDHAYIGAGSVIDLTGRVDIGAHTAVSPACVLMTHADPGSTFGNRLAHAYPRTVGDIRIGGHSWIGTGTTILAGVAIGDGVVIGAASLVNRDVPAGDIVYGVPATSRGPVPHARP